MAQVSGKIIQELLLILTPFMRDKQQRQAYLELALGTNSPVLGNLEWDGSANVFITQMVNKLVAFGEISPGKPALCALLEVIRKDVGEDIQIKIDNLIERIKEELETYFELQEHEKSKSRKFKEQNQFYVWIFVNILMI
ncbi:hypothetical protein [Scytonema sp. PCC 10023]|uniref:hypothetical protein n=1 Tax=Scytonema sp. PCC 10023 TaxID=1680591 RepID=UPI0039C615D0